MVSSNFIVNNITWTLIFVNPFSNALIDRTGKRTLATTSPVERCVYISSDVGEMLERVLRHEIVHVIMVSYGLNKVLRDLLGAKDVIGIEEFICNIYADYGYEMDYIYSQIITSVYRR